MIQQQCRSILVYAAVPDARMLEQGFYAAEVEALRAHPQIGVVRVTNRLRDVEREDYDGLLSFFYSHSAAACLIARARGRPAVVTGGGEQVFPQLASSRYQWLLRATAFRLSMLFATSVLATSTSDLSQMQKVAVLARHKLGLSFHGALAVEHSNLSDIDNRPPGSFITVCGLDTPQNVARKGVYEAVELLYRALDACSDAYLTIIGRTTCRDIVEEYASKFGVRDKINFAGYVDEQTKIDLLGSHRYYVQLSVYEGFGIGAIEALSQGCLVIHSNSGGLVDTMADFGFILPRENVSDFSILDLPNYCPDKVKLANHLENFRPSRRADTIYGQMFNSQ
jgi:glycosyltransferase involved in cell wall biosynthesis